MIESSESGVRPVVHGSAGTGVRERRVRLYSPEFAVDPHAAYRAMRREHGSLVPVELSPGVAATLVIGYRTALRIMHDEAHFPADPSVWQQGIPQDCPVLPMLMARENAIRTCGDKHKRFRRAYSVLGEVDLLRLHDAVDEAAEALINRFAPWGQADAHSDFALPLTFRVLSDLMGLPQHQAQLAYEGMAMVLDGVNAAAGEQQFGQALAEVVQYKRRYPADDLASRLMAHPEQLTDAEMVMQIALVFAAGNEPTANLIVNALRLILVTDHENSGRSAEYAGSFLGGALSTRDAIDQVLYDEPPLSNFCISYPRQPQLIDNVLLPAHQPVVISLAACNSDPAVSAGDRTGNRAHLAWGAGVHACPAVRMAEIIAARALDQLFDALPEMRLAVPPHELRWRPGVFHRAMAALPVAFPLEPHPLRLRVPPILTPPTQY